MLKTRTIVAVPPPGIVCRRLALAGAVLLCLMAACGAPRERTASPITVFAAASLTDALTEIAEIHEARGGDEVRLSFAASGAVARQIEAGAPADVVVLAEPSWMDRLAAAGRIDTASRRDVIGNRLVVIAASDAVVEGDPLAWLVRTEGRLAIGDPASVPAGAYARTWLQGTGQWEALEPRTVMGADVRAVRAFVARGEAALGVVYRSDAAGSDDVRIVVEPASGQQPRIVYPAALTATASPAAADFLRLLASPEAGAVLRRHGFEPLE